MRSQRHAGLGLAQICLAGVLWGTGGLGVQLIRQRVPVSVLTLSAWRMALAAVVLLAALVALRRLPALGALVRTHRGRAVVVGCGTAAYQALYFGAVVGVGVSAATVVSLGLAPVLLTVAEAVALRRPPGTGALAVLALALVGLTLVTLAAGHHETGPHPRLGLLLACGSGATYAATTALGRRLAAHVDPLTLTTATTTAGALVLAPAALVGGDVGRPFTDPTAAVTLAFLGVATMALAYGLFYAGLRTATGSAAVIATLLEPVTAALLASLLLGERLGVAGTAGAALILVAVAGLGRRPEPGVAAPP